MYRNNRERSDAHFTQFFPMVTYCKTIVPYHKDTDTDIIKIQNIFLTTRIPRATLLCCSVSVMSNFSVAPWTVAHHAPLFMGFPRQEYRSGLPFLSPGDLHKSVIEPMSPVLTGGFFTTEPPGKPSPYLSPP